MFPFLRSFTNGVFSFRSEMKIEFLVSVLLCATKGRYTNFKGSFAQIHSMFVKRGEHELASYKDFE